MRGRMSPDIRPLCSPGMYDAGPCSITGGAKRLSLRVHGYTSKLHAIDFLPIFTRQLRLESQLAGTS